MKDKDDKKYFSWGFHFRFLKWDINFGIQDKIWKDHQCMNGWMDGDYQCEVCNP